MQESNHRQSLRCTLFDTDLEFQNHHKKHSEPHQFQVREMPQIARLNSKQQAIYKVLTQKTLYRRPSLDENFFNVDLVFKLRIPMEEYTERGSDVPLSQFIYNPQRNLQAAYESAFEEMLQEMELKEEKQDEKIIQIRNQTNLKPIGSPRRSVGEEDKNDERAEWLHQKEYEVLLSNNERDSIEFSCQIEQRTNAVDSFMLKYNTLVYVLQSHCGFRVNSFTEATPEGTFVYLLLGQSTQNLMKSADRYRIKKEVDYSQLDLFLNEPVDALGRPFQNNSHLLADQAMQLSVLAKFQELSRKQNGPYSDVRLVQYFEEEKVARLMADSKRGRNHRKSGISSSSAVRQADINIRGISEDDQSWKEKFIQANSIRQLYKRAHRNMKDKSYTLDTHVVGEIELQQKEKAQVVEFTSKMFFELDSILAEDTELSAEQKSYIYDINRCKVNPKCQKEYQLKLKRKRFFEKIKELSGTQKYQTYEAPCAFFPFVLPSKKLSFIERLRGVFLYEEYTVSPYGDLSLFSQMDRTKIALLTMREFIRTENLNRIGGQIYALHNPFEIFGIREPSVTKRKAYPQITGGINGKNLIEQWNPFTPWKSSIVSLRNYFGENTAHQVYLKNHLILLFLWLTPLGVIGEASSRIFIYYNENFNEYQGRGFSSTHKQELIFYLVFFLLALGLFGFFLERWLVKEQQFKSNFVEDNAQLTFRLEFEGPFVRNSVTDSVNEFVMKPSLAAQVRKFSFLLAIVVALVGAAGFFFGMRMAIVELAIIFPRTNVYLISWAHILSYGVFFITNSALFSFAFEPLFEKLTQWENLPTEEDFRGSLKNKSFLFLVGVQLIGPIFFLIVEPFAGTSCFSASCHDEFKQYIYSRYIILFFFLAAKLARFLIGYFRSGTSREIQRIQQLAKDSEGTVCDFDQKALLFTEMVTREAQKEEYQPSLQDETLALLLYGMFATTFPLSPILSLASVTLEYLIERIQLIYVQRRPIPKAEPTDNFAQKFLLILHLSIFINCWLVFFTLEQVEYTFQRWIRVFIGDHPTQEGIFILKIVVIILAILLFEAYVQFIRHFVHVLSPSKTINLRKQRKFQKFLMNKNFTKKSKNLENQAQISPFRTIFRTFHKQVIDKFKKTQMVNFDTEDRDQTEQQSSSHFITKPKAQ